jgi:RimJ/RimL family protein N-acetyltransferase
MIQLREIRETDLALFLKWRNDKKIRRYFREFRELTAVDEINWFQNLAGNTQVAMFTIDDAEGSPIGCCGLTGIDWFNRSAEVSLYIGDSYVDGRARPALDALIEVAFKDYGLHRLNCEVWAFDTLKADLLTAAGFKHEGTMLKSHWYNDSFHDSLIFGKLNKE